MVIVASSKLDGSASTQKLLLDKLENYFGYIGRVEFVREFGPPDPTRVNVIVKCHEQPDPVITELLKRCEPWASEQHATLRLQVGEG